MSKAFTKESDDGVDDLPLVEDEALPPGVKNYLTPAGVARLRGDIDKLRTLPREDARRKLAIERRLAGLVRRLEAAEVIDPLTQPTDRVLFGATVTVRDEEDRERSYRIVGIDESDARRGWISWRSPIARALLNQQVGATATVHTPRGDEDWRVIAIAYHADDPAT